jgi:hypothetical protein
MQQEIASEFGRPAPEKTHIRFMRDLGGLNFQLCLFEWSPLSVDVLHIVSAQDVYQ